jgi:two-component system cell cycle response regulator
MRVPRPLDGARIVMPRLTRRVFTDLAIWMVGFGLLIGFVFPPFSIALGLPADRVLTPAYFAATLVAGLVVGAANFALAKLVVGRSLRLLADRMGTVEGQLAGTVFGSDENGCDPEHCRLPVDSDDEVGASARAFNRLIETLARSRRIERARRDFSSVLSSELDVDVLACAALRSLLEHIPADRGSILLAEDGGLRVAACKDVQGERLLGNRDVLQALRTSRTELIRLDAPDAPGEPGQTPFRAAAGDTPFGAGAREVLIAPIVFGESPRGCVVLVSDAAFDADGRGLVEQFRSDLGLAMNNCLALDRLERLAAIDPLTDAFNRRHGLDRLREEFSRAARAESMLGVLMLDLDHFKTVNDTYGHVTGDRVLRAVARACRRVMRDGDVLVRYGGEEFLAILPGAAAEDLERIGERIRRVVAGTTVDADGHRVGVTMSVGAATYSDTANTPEALVKLADDALYAAKRGGRDRLVLARPSRRAA